MAAASAGQAHFLAVFPQFDRSTRVDRRGKPGMHEDPPLPAIAAMTDGR
ncbi:hypothetical protein SAMCFNEI73_Ch1130 [Sinorhizobium americanum]|uniref:Uncharacterized protein n=1 Tax=Sinorhizobium americanum TaxID=194963 RepID=A0A1L3LK70_9HYPH|nr:hypothetical protein SAMCCGM7_Ch1121 [Sinorhizobium americanum CCGM7]APG90446.1 hypothetical protein SAMCFNEI73_Ch1130 [Sinorhizobium americanum]